MNTSARGRTLYDKIWDEHVVHTEEDPPNQGRIIFAIIGWT